ncbi:MAG: FAD-dependent oxidoreductase [Methyloceanibacter sp.]
MVRDNTVAVVGAGVIGAAVAYALTREGRAVLLLDRADPGMTGASFGNAGHIAAELVEPLPSWDLLFGFWRELFAFGGALEIPLRRAPKFLPWARRFAAAARHRAENTRRLAPLVKPAAGDMAGWLAEIGRSELLRTNGHFEVWFGPRADEWAAEQGLAMDRLGIPTQAAPNEILDVIARQTARNLQPRVSGRPKNARVAGLWFTSTAHVLDPLKIVQSLVGAALQRGASLERTEVRTIKPLEGPDRPTYELRDPDRRRGRPVYGCLDRKLVGAARLARADGKRTRVSRGDGRPSSAHRRANPLCRLAHLAHSDGRTTTRFQLHGVCWPPRRTRPAKMGAIAYTP